MKCRLSRKFLSLISNIYNNVNLCVRVKGGLTQNFQSEVGVKQCCNLSPNLFNTFLYDLENIFSDNRDVIQLNNVEIRCLMYADDLSILSKSEVVPRLAALFMFAVCKTVERLLGEPGSMLPIPFS